MTKTIFNMNKTATGILLAALGAAPSLPGEAAQPKGMRIEHPGINNTLVRIDSTANFLLLPVQESSDDARINLLVDGKSGVVDFSENFPAVTVAPTFEKDGKLPLRIFIDRSSFECFGNDGRSVMTNIVSPTALIPP